METSPLGAILPVMLYRLLVLSGSILAMIQAPTPEIHTWAEYANVRFEYAICYPRDLLSPQEEAPDGDGRRFEGKDGAQLLVYGWNNVLGQSLSAVETQISDRLAGISGQVTYHKHQPSWFVISGQNGSDIFYAKTIASRDQFKTFELTYPRSAAAIYDEVAIHLTICFEDLAQ